MANRDMTNQQFSFEKHRKSLNAHLYFGSTGAVTLDAQGSKGVLSVSKVATPAINGTYTLLFGWAQGTTNYNETYVKSLVIDNAPEIEYTGATNPAATATLAILRDDINNNIPLFGDQAAVTGAFAASGADGSFAGGQAFKWLVAPVDAFGNEVQLATLLAQEVSGTPGVNQHATISWTALAGAASYNVYRTLAAGASGSECVFVGNTSGITLNDLGTAGGAVYQGGAATLGVGGKKIPNKNLPAYNFARPAFGYGALTIIFLSGTTPTNPAAGEGMRIQIELGDSDAP
jgi:hypothetical protein